VNYDKLYSQLTPAEKAKHTRLYNRLNDRRVEASRLVFEIYREKQQKLSKEDEPKIAELKENFEALRAEHQAIIDSAREKMQKTIRAITELNSTETLPEWEQYNKIAHLATERFKKEWDEAQAEFFKSAGITK